MSTCIVWAQAVQKCPDDCKALEQQFAQRSLAETLISKQQLYQIATLKTKQPRQDDQGSQKNAEAEAIRKEWIGKSVIPLLKQCQILNGFSMKLVSKIAGPLLKTTRLGQDLRAWTSWFSFVMVDTQPT